MSCKNHCCCVNTQNLPHTRDVKITPKVEEKGGWLYPLKNLYKKSERFFHLLVGMPSYDKYLEYMQTFHPDSTPKSRAEFFREAQDKRYNGGSSRCC